MTLIASSVSISALSKEISTLEKFENSKEPYGNIIRKFNQLENLSQKNFERLVFKRSSFQFRDAKSPKFILEDQFSRRWLFKMEEVGADGALAIQKLYTIFGLYTPDVFRVTLNINGIPTKGYIQVFHKTKGTLYENSLYSLNENDTNYLAQAHLLDWLAANHHVHPGQFIVIKQKQGSSISHIDNSVEWQLFDSDQLSIHYESPIMWNVRQVGYSGFWRTILLRKSIDFNALFSLVKLIVNFPEDAYTQLFKDIFTNQFQWSTNKDLDFLKKSYPEINFSTTKTDFIKHILKRKSSIVKDYSTFLDFIVRNSVHKHLDIGGFKDVSPKRAADRIQSYLNERILLAEKERDLLKKHQPNKKDNLINIIISKEAFDFLSRFLCAVDSCEKINIEQLLKEINASIKSAMNKYHKESLVVVKTYIEQNRNIDRNNSVKLNDIQYRANKIFPVKKDL